MEDCDNDNIERALTPEVPENEEFIPDDNEVVMQIHLKIAKKKSHNICQYWLRELL